MNTDRHGYRSMVAIDMARADASRRRVDEAVFALRHKAVRSTTLERVRITWEADARVAGLSQPLQIGEGLYYMLDRISVPVSAGDLILGRISEEVPDEEGEAFFQARMAAWPRGLPPWMGDGGHEWLQSALRTPLPRRFS